MEDEALSPSEKNIFELNENMVPLEKVKLYIYHHNAAKLIFLSNQTRLVILTMVSSLSTKVK